MEVHLVLQADPEAESWRHWCTTSPGEEVPRAEGWVQGAEVPEASHQAQEAYHQVQEVLDLVPLEAFREAQVLWGVLVGPAGHRGLEVLEVLEDPGVVLEVGPGAAPVVVLGVDPGADPVVVLAEDPEQGLEGGQREEASVLDRAARDLESEVLVEDPEVDRQVGRVGRVVHVVHVAHAERAGRGVHVARGVHVVRGGRVVRGERGVRVVRAGRGDRGGLRASWRVDQLEVR